MFKVDDVSEFGDSWALEDGKCSSDPGINPCEEGSETYQQAQELCHGLISETGPFRDCNDTIDPTAYYNACVYDLCATLPDEDLICDSYAEYAHACRETGGEPGDWRSVTPQCRKLKGHSEIKG